MTPEEIAQLPYRPNVGMVLINQHNQIFAAQRLDRYMDAWQMPQGGIDPGEDPEVAALRELEEETGVTSDLVEILGQSDGWLPYDLPHELVPKLWKGKYRGQEQKWFLFRFLGQDADINIETEHPEFSKWTWMGKDELLQKIVPFKQDVYSAVFAEFEGYL
ncbi:RNA pyrophosphohydrolase [Algirhabdus cladophorae]|uniref:RNA pyrophosphohydrolase n=1 Tax=Algirhabdus cladophorae TaxID=3377108 RepID=UPI003B8452FA